MMQQAGIRSRAGILMWRGALEQIAKESMMTVHHGPASQIGGATGDQFPCRENDSDFGPIASNSARQASIEAAYLRYQGSGPYGILGNIVDDVTLEVSGDRVLVEVDGIRGEVTGAQAREVRQMLAYQAISAIQQSTRSRKAEQRMLAARADRPLD